MASTANIDLMGATYPDVPAVTLPTHEGGTATFWLDGGVDTSGDTVDAAHLLDGYTAHDSTGSAIVGTYVPPTFTTQAKTATPTTSQQTVAPDSGYDGLSSVTVAAIPSEYIIPSGTKSITENGTYDVADYAWASVAVPTGATNVVFGQFTASTAGTVQEVSVSYSGSGRPIFIGVYLNGGGESAASIDHAYAILEMSAYRDYHRINIQNDKGYGAYLYRMSSGPATAKRINGPTMFYTSNDPTSGTGCVVVRDANNFAVLVSDTSYGFLSGQIYNYVIVYSS